METMCSCTALTGLPTAWSRRPAANGGAHTSCQPRQTGKLTYSSVPQELLTHFWRTCNIISSQQRPTYRPSSGSTFGKLMMPFNARQKVWSALAPAHNSIDCRIMRLMLAAFDRCVRFALTICRTVTDFRKWLDKRGRGGPIKGDPGPILEDRRVLLDRYEQHVKHCKACTQVRTCCPLESNTGRHSLQCILNRGSCLCHCCTTVSQSGSMIVFLVHRNGITRDAVWLRANGQQAVHVTNSAVLCMQAPAADPGVLTGRRVLQALSVFKALRIGAAVLAAACLLTASGLAGGGAKLASVPVLALSLTAAGCAFAWQKLCRQIEKFYFTDYKHSET